LAKELEQHLPLAIDRLRQFHPDFRSLAQDSVPSTPLSLHHAQLVIAREYGYRSWTKLRDEVNRITLERVLHAVQLGKAGEVRTLLRQNPKLVNYDMSETDEHRLIHFAVLRRDEPMVRALMRAGADARKGIYPYRDATTAYVMASDRELSEIVSAIEEEEQRRREDLSCPNAIVSPAQDELYAHIRSGSSGAAIKMLAADPGLSKACDREGGTALHVACEEGALSVIDRLLELNANPRKQNLKGLPPLESAALRVTWKERWRRTAFPEAARRLLRRGAEESPIVAAALGDLKSLQEMHRREPALFDKMPNMQHDGVLSIAVTFGRYEALKFLLEIGLDVNERHQLESLEEEVFSSGKPLWLAAAFGEYEMAKLLLAHGADASAQVYASGTPVDRAYSAQNEPIKKLLAAHGGHPEPAQIGWSRDFAAAQKLTNSDTREDVIAELLWGAACGGSVEIVRMCIEKIDWDTGDSRWFRILTSPLSLANHAPHSDHPELFDRSTYPECLRIILRHGVNVNIRGRKGETLLHSIIAAGRIWGREVMTNQERLEFMRIALDAAPDVGARDDLLLSTPLGWACRWGRKEIVQMLLEYGASPHEPDAEPWATPMAWAKKMKHSEIAALLQSSP